VHLPREDNSVAPLEIFCGCTLDLDIIRKAHVWGSPAYVLDPTIQDGRKLPRWQPKSRREQYLGISKRHASTIGLIRNLRTGSVSPQSHVVYDDFYTTIPTPTMRMQSKPINWEELLTLSRERITTDDGTAIPPLSDEWLDERELQDRNRIRGLRLQQNRQVPAVTSEGARQTIREREFDEDDDDDGIVVSDPIVDEHIDNNDDESVESIPTGRPARDRRVNPRYFGPEFVNHVQEFIRDFRLLNDEEAFLASLSFDTDKVRSFEASLHAAMQLEKVDEDGISLGMHPLAFAAGANSDDTPNFHQAMNGPDAEGFYEAMQKEIEQLESMDAWEVVPRSQTHGKRLLDSIWAFKPKQYPDGQVRKLKARFCGRGDQQIEGVDFLKHMH
jgi:hypothetical protein